MSTHKTRNQKKQLVTAHWLLIRFGFSHGVFYHPNWSWMLIRTLTGNPLAGGGCTINGYLRRASCWPLNAQSIYVWRYLAILLRFGYAHCVSATFFSFGCGSISRFLPVPVRNCEIIALPTTPHQSTTPESGGCSWEGHDEIRIFGALPEKKHWQAKSTGCPED